MKKLILLLMLLLSISVFAEKLTTDGKDNLDKMKGVWYSEKGGVVAIAQRKGFWKIGIYGDPGEGEHVEDRSGSFTWEKLKKMKPGVYLYVLKNEGTVGYYSYDIKYKKLVELDKNLNIKAIFEKDTKERFK